MVGRTVRQHFTRFGWHNGKVVKRLPTVARVQEYFMVEYDDGDSMELTEDQLSKWLEPKSAAAAGQRLIQNRV
jgi:hypothetical protein